MYYNLRKRPSVMIDFSKFDSLFQFVNYFNSEAHCKKAIAEARWGGGEAVCPFCGCTHTYNCEGGKYSCSHCGKRFSVMFEKAVKSFKYADVLRMSTSIDLVSWKIKHDSYYWMRKMGGAA